MIKAEDIKKLLTVQDLINIILSLGAEIKSKNNKEIIFTSICHHKDANNHKPKLYFYINTKSFFCYSCSSAFDIFSLVQKRKELLGEKCSFVQALKYVCDFCGIDAGDIKEEIKNDNKCDWQSCLNKYLRYKNSYSELKVYDKSILDNFPRLYHQDWLDYGITMETMEKYNIRYYPYRNQILIPCFQEDGSLIGIRVRNMDEIYLKEGNPKYFPLYLLDGTSFEFPTNLCFYGENYNLEEIKRTGIVWLVESEKSVLKMDSWFGEHNVSLAMYGSNLGKKRFDKLISLGLNEVVIMLDSDFHSIYEDGELTEKYMEFEKKVLKMAKPFKPYVNKITCCFNNQGYEGYKFSACDFTREQFDILYKNREEIF